jgi:hypothetical protein
MKNRVPYGQAWREIAGRSRFERTQQLPLDFTVHGAQIVYQNRSYQFLSEIEALKRAICHEAQQFLTPRLTSLGIEQATEQSRTR